jgi:hypothetical protein
MGLLHCTGSCTSKSLSFRYPNVLDSSGFDVTLIPTAKVAGKGEQ